MASRKPWPTELTSTPQELLRKEDQVLKGARRTEKTPFEPFGTGYQGESSNSHLYPAIRRGGPAATPYVPFDPTDTTTEYKASYLEAGDKDDKKWLFRSSLIPEKVRDTNEVNSIIPGIGEVQLDESYFNYIEKKKELEFLREYRIFVWNQMNLRTPESREWWEKRFPQYTQDYYDAYSEKLELDKRLAMVNLKGIQNEDDLLLKYLWEKGEDIKMDVLDKKGKKMGSLKNSGISPFSANEKFNTGTLWLDIPSFFMQRTTKKPPVDAKGPKPPGYQMDGTPFGNIGYPFQS